MGKKQPDKEIFPVPLIRREVPNSNWFIWIMAGATPKLDVIIASEHVYSTVYSRFLRLGDIVRATKGCPDVPKGTVGVLIKIHQPHDEAGHTNYVYHVVFEGRRMPTDVKVSHLDYHSSQRIKIGQPVWLTPR